MLALTSHFISIALLASSYRIESPLMARISFFIFLLPYIISFIQAGISVDRSCETFQNKAIFGRGVQGALAVANRMSLR
jgi:hypothetical protein